MASETQSCEMFFQDRMSEKNSKQLFFTKWKLIGLICLIFGILLTLSYISLSQMNEKFESFTSEMNQKLENLSNDIEELKHNE